MARRITFDEFRRRLESGRLTTQELQDYLEIDPTAPTIRVRLRPGTLVDAPPADYDADEALYQYERAKGRAAQKARARIAGPRVVAEGDSWFHLPPLFWPKAIADRIKADGRFDVSNIARWGDTLQEILEQREYLGEIRRFKPAWFMVSAGGGDIQEALARGALLHSYDPARPLEQSVTSEGALLLEQIGRGYRTLLAAISAEFPDLPVLCYGYDYPRPNLGEGRYIGRYFRALGYPENTMRALAEIIIDRLNEVISKAVAEFERAQYIRCLRVTDPFTWFDDMHPHGDGFEALAEKFEERMTARALSQRPSARRGRRRRTKARR
jgi:hypothetical protein